MYAYKIVLQINIKTALTNILNTVYTIVFITKNFTIKFHCVTMEITKLV